MRKVKRSKIVRMKRLTGVALVAFSAFLNGSYLSFRIALGILIKCTSILRDYLIVLTSSKP